MSLIRRSASASGHPASVSPMRHARILGALTKIALGLLFMVVVPVARGAEQDAPPWLKDKACTRTFDSRFAWFPAGSCPIISSEPGGDNFWCGFSSAGCANSFGNTSIPVCTPPRVLETENLTCVAQCSGGAQAQNGICPGASPNKPRGGRGSGQCQVGNPCDPATGNKLLVEADYVGAGRFPLQFVRYYNSTRLTGTGHPVWGHGLDARIRAAPGDPGSFVDAVRPGGSVLSFRSSGTAREPDGDIQDRLERLTDGSGATTGWVMTTADGDVVERYDAAGKLATLTDRAGLTQTLSYSDGTANPPNGQTFEGSGFPAQAGFLIRVVDQFGRTLKLGYDTGRRIARVTVPDGKNILFAYGRFDNVTSVTYPDNAVRLYHYNEPEHTGGANLDFALTGITDENNVRYATYKYNSTGRAISTEHAGPVQTYSFTYNADGTTVVTDPLVSARTYSFEALQGLKRLRMISGPVGPQYGPASQTYDANANVASRTDWNGNRTCFNYDTARNLETIRAEGLSSACPGDLSGWTPAAGTVERKITTEWHSTWRLLTKTCEPKRITTLAYDTKGNITSRSIEATNDASGAQGCSAAPVGTARTWTYTYAYGTTNPGVPTQIVMDGPRTDVTDATTYAYDETTGNLLSITNALGQVTQITAYNAHGQPLVIVDPNGLTTTLTYDARQRLISRTVGTETTGYEYDGVGQMTKVTLPDGSFLAYAFDAAHRLTAIQDNLGNRIAHTLDAMGNRTREDVFDPAGQLAQTRSRVYSNLNRLTQEIGGTDPATQITSYGYDNQGNVTAITDPLSHATVNAYDALNRLKQVTDPANGVTAYGLDGLHQLVSVSDARSNATTYTLDGLGDLAAQSSPDTGPTANTHDAAGNPISSTDAKGQSTSYTYDALNRLTRIVYNQAAAVQLKQVDYAYDQGANGIGRLSSITEPSAAGAVLQTTTYGYDPHGRIVSEARAMGGQTYTTAYAYDAAGRMSGMTYPSGRTTAYGFDGSGRVNRIETTGATQTQVVVQDVAYHPFGAPKAFTFGNLQAYGRSFDLDGRIATHTLTDQTRILSFDAASRITGIAQQGNPANTNTYGYDALDRLTNAVLPTSTFAFSYDPVGNRLSKSIGGNVDSYTYSPAGNRLSAITGTSGTRTYVHDPNGSITADGANSLAYDARGRLVSATSAAGTTSFQVNALGQRVRKTSVLGDTVYHYDTQGRLIAESSGAGAPMREYLWLNDQPVAVVAAAQSQSGTGCPATPQLDTSNTFQPFGAQEGLEAHSGRPGGRGWEWRIGTNLRRPKTSDETDLDWVSGKLYGFRLTYDGAGNASVTVQDGHMALFTLSQTGGMDVANALRFQVRSAAGLKAGTLIQARITSIDGQAASETLQTAGDGKLSDLAKVFAGESLTNGFTVEGTVSITFTGSFPPRGSRLRFLVTAGNVTCQGPPPVTEAKLYYIHADHLNTPRAITDEQQRVVWRWENTEPFGKSPPEEDPDGDGVQFEFPLRFPGQYFDA